MKKWALVVRGQNPRPKETQYWFHANPNQDREKNVSPFSSPIKRLYITSLAVWLIPNVCSLAQVYIFEICWVSCNIKMTLILYSSYLPAALFLLFPWLLQLSKPGWSLLILLIEKMRIQELTFLAQSQPWIIGRGTLSTRTSQIFLLYQVVSGSSVVHQWFSGSFGQAWLKFSMAHQLLLQ